MESKDKNENIRKAKAPLADENHQLDPSVTGKGSSNKDKKAGKLPDDDLDVDQHSDPVTSKTQ